jgi:hypothetical protein
MRAFLDMDSGDLVLEIVNKAKSIGVRTARYFSVLYDDASIAFGVDHTAMELVFRYAASNNPEGTKELGRVDSLDITGLDLVGPAIGIFAKRDVEVEAW